MTLSSTGSLSCDGGLHICDTASHSCSDFLPTSSTQENSYTLMFADQNFIHSLAYEVSIVATCPGGGSIDYTVCAPVLGGVYPTACVFNGNPAGLAQGVYFGVDGCGCQTIDSQGFSTCWDGSQPSSDDFNYGVQECGPYCPLPPSDSSSASHSSSISVTRSFTSSRSKSSSEAPAVSRTVSPSPSNASQSSSKPGQHKEVIIGVIGGAIVASCALLALALWCYCRIQRVSAETPQKKRKQQAERNDDIGVLLQRGTGGSLSLNGGGADYSASLLDGVDTASRV